MAKVFRLPTRSSAPVGAVDTTGEPVAEPEAAGAPVQTPAEPAVLERRLADLLAATRAASVRLLNAPATAETEVLTNLLHNHVVIQGNIAELHKRLQAAVALADGAAQEQLLAIGRDLEMTQDQVAQYTAAVAEIVGDDAQQAPLATTKSRKVLWFFLALGAVGVGVVAWKMTRKKRGGRPKKLLGDVDKD